MILKMLFEAYNIDNLFSKLILGSDRNSIPSAIWLLVLLHLPLTLLNSTMNQKLLFSNCVGCEINTVHTTR